MLHKVFVCVCICTCAPLTSALCIAVIVSVKLWASSIIMIWSFSFIPDAFRVAACRSDWYGKTTTWNKVTENQACPNKLIEDFSAFDKKAKIIVWRKLLFAGTRMSCFEELITLISYIMYIVKYLVKNRLFYVYTFACKFKYSMDYCIIRTKTIMSAESVTRVGSRLVR